MISWKPFVTTTQQRQFTCERRASPWTWCISLQRCFIIALCLSFALVPIASIPTCPAFGDIHRKIENNQQAQHKYQSKNIHLCFATYEHDSKLHSIQDATNLIDEIGCNRNIPSIVSHTANHTNSTSLGKNNTEFINGTSDGMIITKVYSVPSEGFRMFGDVAKHDGMPVILDLFTLEDRQRLHLSVNNVTLPVALMLLDSNLYPTQSRARKSIRQRAICIRRSSNHPAHNGLKELGKVDSRVYPGDAIGFQQRSGSDYYAIQGVPYRPPYFEVPVVYEDDYMAIVNKPPGVVLYRAEGGRGGGARGGGHGRDTLLSALPFILQPSSIDGDKLNDGDHPLNRPQPVHRLDRSTSGLVVVAKTKFAATHLAQQFELRKAKKTYMAIVNGHPVQPGKIESTWGEWNMIDFNLDGKNAVTEWRVIKQVNSKNGNGGVLTLVELKPLTGRYHQLRRHMAWVCNSPIVGDSKYDQGDEAAIRLRKRGLFLCSNKIAIEHPYYNKPNGRNEWSRMKYENESTMLYEENKTGCIMVKASIELPDKFRLFFPK